MRSSKPRRRIPRRWRPPRLLLPLPVQMAGRSLFLYMILVPSRCHSVDHCQDRRAPRRSRTVPHKLTLPRVGKANPPKVTWAKLLPDSPVKVYLTWASRTVHPRHSRLSRLIEGSSVWFHSLEPPLSIIYSTFPLLLATSYSDLFFCTDHFLFDVL